MNALERVLYVDDDPDIREIAELALGDLAGLTVAVGSSGLEALDLVRSFGPQLVLLDVMMPGMDGPTAMQQIHDDPEFGQLPVVFLTAKIQSDEVERYLRLGAVDVIAKPFDPLTLGDQLREIWARLSA
jgi:two-component system, OmpR family, response regulator